MYRERYTETDIKLAVSQTFIVVFLKRSLFERETITHTKRINFEKKERQKNHHKHTNRHTK